MEEMKETPQAEPELNKPTAVSLEQIKNMTKAMPRRQRRELLRKFEKILKKQKQGQLSRMRELAREAAEATAGIPQDVE